MNPDATDCTTCGACCQFGGEVVVSRAENLPKYLTRSVRGVIGFASWEAEDIVRMARTPDNRCVALRGEVNKTCHCAIYLRRPNVCREFVPGSEECVASKRAAYTMLEKTS